MSDLKDQHGISDIEKRLYDRGVPAESLNRHLVKENDINVARDWKVSAAATPTPIVVPPARTYRKVILLARLALWGVGGAAAAAFVYFGGRKISADNITFVVDAPTTIKSNDIMPLSISVTNQNSVAIKDATLIVQYPEGSRAVVDINKHAFEDRIDVDTLNPGETKNIPLQVYVFGKENASQFIKATLKYKVADSDGTFYKEANPHNFQIISSPVTLSVSSIGKVSAGQPVEVILTVTSNTDKTLENILVTAQYPSGFVFSDSTPKPAYDKNAWQIKQLKSESSVKIKIKGSIVGLTTEKFGINFEAGLPDPNNPFIVSSELAEARTEFTIERPFIAVDVNIGGADNETAVIEPGFSTSVSLGVKNTLDESVYDMVVEVVPSGNALSMESVDTQQGFYDSNRNVIRFDSVNTPELAQVNPGDSRSLVFSLRPTTQVGPSSFGITVNVYARRINEPSAQENLIGTATAEARYASAAILTSQVKSSSGPVPPKVGQTTAYLATIAIEGGANNLRNAVVTTNLPSYVNWRNEYSGGGTVAFNPVSKQLTWTIGDINAGAKRELTFLVDILPSSSQIGITPYLVEEQTFSAIDRFTNRPVRTENNEITTEVSGEQSGSVIP